MSLTSLSTGLADQKPLPDAAKITPAAIAGNVIQGKVKPPGCTDRSFTWGKADPVHMSGTASGLLQQGTHPRAVSAVRRFGWPPV